MLPVIMRGQHGMSIAQRMALVTLIGVVALVTSTQALAWRLDYQAALGPHIHHWYAPWRIIFWTIAWYAQYPTLICGAWSAGICIASVLLIAMLIQRSLSTNSSHATDYLHGSARWAEKTDIHRAALFADNGVYVGGWEDSAGKQHYLRHNGSEHILTIAPTRSGKGICLVIPTLLSWRQSCVITDLKGELWALTAGWRKKYAQNHVLLFEPAARLGSIGWNPMEEVRLGAEYEIGDAQNLATMLVDPDGRGLNDHWQKTSQALLVGCILHMLYKKKNGDADEASLPSVDAMLADPDKSTDELWKEMISYPHLQEGGVHPAVAKSAQDMIDRPEEERGSVLSTAKSYLALFRDPVVAANVRTSGFKIKDLMNHDKPISLYIVTQPDDKLRLRPLVRILINMICRINAGKMVFAKTDGQPLSRWQKILRRLQGKSLDTGGGRRAKSSNKFKMLMMLDEFPSLGKLEIVQESLAYLAGYGIRFYIICQDMNQLRSESNGYGRDEAISSNCHIQLAFQPSRLETAEYLSKLTGSTTVVKEQVTVSGNRFGAMQGNLSRTMQEVSRPLMTPDECMRMPPPEKRGEILIKGGNMLVYVAGFPCVFGKQMPYFLDEIFSERSKIDPPMQSDELRREPNRQLVADHA